MNEEIIKLIATLDADPMVSGISKIISEFKRMANESKKIAQESSKSTAQALSNNFSNAMKSITNLPDIKSQIANVQKQLSESMKNYSLLSSTKGGGKGAAIAKQEIVQLIGELGNLSLEYQRSAEAARMLLMENDKFKSRAAFFEDFTANIEEGSTALREMVAAMGLAGRGAGVGDRAIGRAINADYTTQMQKMALQLETSTKGMHVGTIAFNNELVKAIFNYEKIEERKRNILTLMQEMKTAEAEINIYLKTQNLENALIAKKKLNMVSIAGVLIDKNNTVYKLDKNIQNETQILLNDQTRIMTIYDAEINRKKEILSLGIRNKNISMEELGLLRNSILELERKKKTALQPLAGRAMGIESKLYAGTPEGLDAQRLSIITKYEAAQARITAQERLMVIENKALVGLGIQGTSIYGQIVDLTYDAYVNSKMFDNVMIDISKIGDNIIADSERELGVKRDILRVMNANKVAPELIEAETRDILNLEKKRVTELEKIKNLAREIQETILSTGKGVSVGDAELKIKKLMNAYKETTKEATHMGKKASEAGIRLGGATQGMIRQFSILRNRLLVLTFAFAGLVRMGKKWIDLSLQAIKRETSLSIISTNLGISISDVTKATKELASDGVISINGATQAVKNLLSTGASLKIVTETINVLKDAALANGRDFFTAEENITSFTQGLKEGRSQVTDNIGVMTNLSVVAKKYKDIIKEVGYANGILIGFMKEAAMYEGTRAKLMQTLAGRMMFLKTAVLELKISLGTVLQPVMENILGLFEVWTKKIKEFSDVNKFKISEYVDYVGKSIKTVMELVINSTTNIMKIFSVFSSVIVGTFGIIKGVFGTKGLSWIIAIGLSFKIASAGAKGLIKTMFALRNTIKSIIALEFMQNLIPEKSREKFIADLGLVKGAINKLKFSWHSALSFMPSLGWILPVTVAITALTFLLGKLIKKHRELDAVTRERTSYSKDVLIDTAKQEEVIGAMDKMFKNDSAILYYDNLIKINNAEKEMIRINKSFEGGLKARDVQIKLVKDYSKLNKKLLKEITSEEFEFLQKQGIIFDSATGELIQYGSRGEEIFRMSYKNFKQLNTSLNEYKDKIGPIPQFQDDLSSAVNETANKVKELRNQIDALEVPSLTKDFKDVFNTFKEGKENIDAIKVRLTDLDVKLKGVINNRQSLQKALAPFKLSPEMMNELVNTGLKNAKDMMVKLQEYLGVSDKGMELVYELFFGQMKINLSNFEKNIKDTTLELKNAYDDYIQELSGLNEQMDLAKTGATKGSLSSTFLKENLKMEKEKLDIQQKYTKQISDMNTELADADKYYNKLVVDADGLNLSMTDKRVVEQLNKINAIKLQIERTTTEQVNLEKLMNDILGVRKELIFWQEYNEFMTSAESKYNELVGNAENGPGLLTQWIFGGKGARGNIRERGQKILDGLIRQAQDIKKVSISLSESIKTPELANGKTVISDTEMKALDDWVEKLNNMNPVMVAMGKEIVDTATQMAQGVTNAYMQMIDANRQLNEQMYSTRVELKRQRELGVISEEEYNLEIKKAEEQAYYDRKAASHRQIQELAVSIRDTLAAKAVEWAIMAVAYKVFAAADTAMMVFPNPAGKLAVAAQYATLAALAGGGAIAANAIATSQGKKAAYWEGMGAAEASKYDTDSATTTGSKGSTSGSTIAAQPQYITINPSVAFYGDYLYLGDTIQEVGEKMSRVIVTEVKEAIDEGEITLSNFK